MDNENKVLIVKLTRLFEKLKSNLVLDEEQTEEQILRAMHQCHVLAFFIVKSFPFEDENHEKLLKGLFSVLTQMTKLGLMRYWKDGD